MERIKFKKGIFVLNKNKINENKDAVIILNKADKKLMMTSIDINCISDEINNYDARLFFNEEQKNKFTELNNIETKHFTVLTIRDAIKRIENGEQYYHFLAFILHEFKFIKLLKFLKP